MIEEIKKLVDLGLPIIPVCAHDHAHASAKHLERCKCPGKTPMIKDWQSHDITTQKDLQSWIQAFKTFNVGLPLGDASGYCGIDVDGEEGVTLLMQMSKGELPSTWEFATGAGNRLLYLIPEGIRTKKFKQSGEGIHQECALLCTGQQTVLPPSIHYTGRKYEWVPGHSPWDIDCAYAPKWLVNKIILNETDTLDDEFQTSTDEFVTADFQVNLPDDVILQNKNVRSQGKTKHAIVVTEELLTQTIHEGNRDNTMTAIIGHYCANRDLRKLGKAFISDVCLKHNLKYCDPPLEDQAIQDKVDYFFEAEKLKDAEYADKKNKPVFEASKMAKNVLQYLNNGGLILHFDQFSKIYYYTTSTKGPWFPTRNRDLINRWIRSVLTSPHYGDATWDKRSYIEETRMALEEQFTTAYKTVDDFDLGAHSKDLRDYIVVNNGMVDWVNKELLPWDYNVKTTISFDVNFEPLATCPRFEKYLRDWLPDQATRDVMQEYLGYCLIPNTNYRKAMFVYGKGKNGKSMLIEFIQDFWGEHKATLSYDGLFTRFGPVQLKDKLVNVFDDTSVSFTKETSIAKNLIAGGAISAEYKGKDAFQFQNIARFIYSSQETPRTSDNTVAWYERWFFIKFPNQFRTSNQAKLEIQTALKEERSGIFNWLIAGLRRLVENDDFSECDLLHTSTMEYQSQNDSVAQFVHTMCVVTDSKEKVSVADLYRIYLLWAENGGLKPVSKKIFSMRTEDMGFKRVKTYMDGKSGQSTFECLTLNRESEEYQDLQFEISMILN